jgi:cobalt-zinc-cadmium efflux system membrane fusion protein
MRSTITVVVMLAALVLVGCDAKTNVARTAQPAAPQAERDEHDHEHEETVHDELDHDKHAHDEHGHEDHEEGEPDFAKIDPARGAALGIAVATAAAGQIDEAVTLTGRLIIDPRRVAAVRARFPGPVVAVFKDVGDSVRKGEALANVESNESLTVYRVSAPIGGVVLARNTNVGDVVSNDALFTVGDVSALIAELQAFSGTQGVLRAGGAVKLTIGEQIVDGRILNVAPELDRLTQARRVRVALSSGTQPNWVSGQFVSGRVALGSNAPAAVAVPVDAVRRLENREVIFIPEEDGYRARAVTVGRRGLTAVEITFGLDAGEQYVSAGAFVLKAEIGKNLAEHNH